MIELSATAYVWIKALHVISVIAWLAGMLYLPRLFVYHCAAAPGSPQSETFKVMERRLMRAIINPAMVAAFVFGAIMVLALSPAIWNEGWWWAKVVFLVGMFTLHGFLSIWRRDFEADRNTRPARFYRIMNEVPTVLMIGIVIFVVVRPF